MALPHNAIFTMDEARDIRTKYKTSRHVTYAVLAEEYHVDPMVITRLVRGFTYRDEQVTD